MAQNTNANNTNSGMLKTTVTESGNLIPIKGIDETRKRLLTEMGIVDSSDLLTAGRTNSQRERIAEKIMYAEKTELSQDSNFDSIKWKHRYIKYVESWVKQADLWRVQDMDPDSAYFLVELGIRYVDDLAKVDSKKAYPIMKCLAQTQADYVLITIERLEQLINNAKKIEDCNPQFRNRLIDNIQKQVRDKALKYVKAKNNTSKLSARENTVLKEGMANFLQNIDSVYLDNIISNFLEFDEEAPEFLFEDNNVDVGNPIGGLNNAEIISKGLDYLSDLEIVLPLPSSITGIVYMLENGQTLPEDAENRRSYVFRDAKVEIQGISSPSEDKGGDYQNPQAYTDANGKFIINFSEKYSLEENLTIIISQGSSKQKFVLTATDLLAHVKEQKILQSFNEMVVVMQDRGEDEKALEEVVEKLSDSDGTNGRETMKYKILMKEKNELESSITLLNEKEKELKAFIRTADQSTSDVYRIVRNLANRKKLAADYSEDSFIIVKSIFKGGQNDLPKVLPSVKLMDNENKSIYLPTDTAPTRIYNYSMLQRLVEPAILPLADIDNGIPRVVLNEGVDVSAFKKDMIENPSSIPQMSSLGIGYVLNMHQAWTPDGFALGNLLYSLVLAPGEEQRLIVREKKQSYQIFDESTGTDRVNEEYANSQTDNTDAAYEYALNQLAQGSSHYDYSTSSTSVGFSAAYAGYGAMLGLSVGHSTSKGNANSSAKQSNAHNEASSSAQRFQHGIKTASERISSAQRISMSMAAGQETDSVATRIIANHNHSHTMTIQYWEVMRRYKLETCIDGVQLVLFVPMKLIHFYNGKDRLLPDISSMEMSKFKERYSVLVENADALTAALPYKYRNGLQLMQKYEALPKWTIANNNTGIRTITFTIYGNFCSLDNIEATLIMKNGRPSIAGEVELETDDTVLTDKTYETSAKLKKKIKEFRRRPYQSINSSSSKDTKATSKCTCSFDVPQDVTDDELLRIAIEYSCEEFDYVLFKSMLATAENGENANDIENYMWDKVWDLAKDNDDSSSDIRKINYAKEILPEAWIAPNVHLSVRDMRELGIPKILKTEFNVDSNKDILGVVSSLSLSSRVYVNIVGATTTLTMGEIKEMEATLQHVASNTMKYSQVIWTALSADERALMLEKYTVDMNYSSLAEGENTESIDISLLNCIDVKKLLGFYGNCMLFPFTYPQELAERINKSAGELQDSLYRYHTNYFRVPTTVISLPTEGMIGESVLGQTNVSEEIDLTRFWNWQDSPIDSMSIDSTYLNNADYLAGKTTKDITALGLTGVTPTTPVTVSDLVTALVNKQTPTFDNITGLDQLKEVLNTATNSNATGRDTALSNSAELAKAALQYAIRNDAVKGENNTGNESNGTNSIIDNIAETEPDEHDYDWELAENQDAIAGFDKEFFKKQITEYLSLRENGYSISDIGKKISNGLFSEEELIALGEMLCRELSISIPNETKKEE